MVDQRDIAGRAVQWARLRFDKHSDERGCLVALEKEGGLPFSPQRGYYICSVPSREIRRGFHSHLGLKQVLVCPQGSVKVLVDNGLDKEIISLDDPSKGLYIGPLVWREMYDFSSDAVLLVIASEKYDPCDYIQDYEQFLNLCETRRK